MGWRIQILGVHQEDYNLLTGTDELAANVTIRLKADSSFDPHLPMNSIINLYYSQNFNTDNWTDDFNYRLAAPGRNPWGFTNAGLLARDHISWVTYDAHYVIPSDIYANDYNIRFTGRLSGAGHNYYTTSNFAAPGGGNTTTYLQYGGRKYNRTHILVNRIENTDTNTGSTQSLNPIIYSDDRDHLLNTVMYVQQLYTEGDGVYATAGDPVDWQITKNSSLGYCVGTEASCSQYSAWSWANLTDNGGNEYISWSDQGQSGFPILLSDQSMQPTGNQYPGQLINDACNKLFLSIGSNDNYQEDFEPLTDNDTSLLQFEYPMSVYAVSLPVSTSPAVVNRLSDESSLDDVLFNIELPLISDFPANFNHYGNVRATSQMTHVFDPAWLEEGDAPWNNTSFDVLTATSTTLGEAVGTYMPVRSIYAFDNNTFDIIDGSLNSNDGSTRHS